MKRTGCYVVLMAGIASAWPAWGQQAAQRHAQARAARQAVEATFVRDGDSDNDGLAKDAAGWPADADRNEAFDGHSSGNDDGGTEQAEQLAPVNDSCSSPTIIPGNVSTYNPATYSTTTATTEVCEAQENCEKSNAGTSNTVWYEYTPDADGRIVVDTYGSSYDTVLSVFGGCGSLHGAVCLAPPIYACNDDAPFGTRSELSLDVQIGATYKIKVADWNTANGGGTLDFNLRYFPANDNCADATVITNSVFDPPLLSTQNADTDVCEVEESCEFNNAGVSNSVWYSYVPPCDGFISVNTNGSDYDTVLSIFDGCGQFIAIEECDLPDEIACDDDSGTGLASQLDDVPVIGGVEYIIKVADYNLSQEGGLLDFNFLFSGAGQPAAEIDSPVGFECVCNEIEVVGSAFAGEDPVTNWVLEYQPAGGGSWTEIAAGQVPVTNDVLAVWNTGGLAEGHYILRLTVENACGGADTAVAVVFVDAAFDTLDLREPDDDDVIGGVYCVDGTVWDRCGGEYTVEYRPQAGGPLVPVDPDNPVFTQWVTNDPIVPNGWNTNGIPDDAYLLRVQATDACGHVQSRIRVVTIDNTPPIAEILDPLNCTCVDGLVNIIGTVDDANLAGWTLQYSGDQQNQWTTIAQGSGPVLNDLLGTWDTTGLPSCPYALRIVSSDLSVVNCDDPHIVEYVTTVNVGACNAFDFDTDDDGDVDIMDYAVFLTFFTGP